MMKKQYLNSLSKNKKGIVFTLDVTIAMIVILSTLAISTFLVVKTTKDPLVNVQSVKIGSDFVNLLERQGYLNNPNGLSIENYINNTLPPQYEMRLEGLGGGTCDFVSGIDAPEEKPITSGKSFFATTNDYCSLKFKIWLK